MTEKKPRMHIEFKTMLMIMAFFGMGTWGSILLFAKRVMWHAVAENTTMTIHAIATEERATTARSLTTMRDSVIEYSEKRFDRIERLVENLPGGKRAILDVDKSEKARQDRSRKIGYSSSNLSQKDPL